MTPNSAAVYPNSSKYFGNSVAKPCDVPERNRMKSTKAVTTSVAPPKMRFERASPVSALGGAFGRGGNASFIYMNIKMTAGIAIEAIIGMPANPNVPITTPARIGPSAKPVCPPRKK